MNLFKKSIGLFEIVLLIVLIFIYYYLTYHVKTDIPVHAQFIKGYTSNSNPFPVNFLYYFVVYLFGFFSSEYAVLLVVSVYVLVFATFFKYFIVKKIIYSELSNSFKDIEVVSTVSSFLMIFAFSLPSILIFKGLYYKYNFPPNVWHNSTTIFVMPFVVLLFWVSLKQLKVFNQKRLIMIMALILVNALVKPSFLFVYLLAYPILLFEKYLFSKLFWINLIPIIVALLLIIAEYYFIYTGPKAEDNSSVAISFFYLFNNINVELNWIYITIILISTIVSGYLFPLVLLVRNRALLKEDMIRFALICAFFGQIISNTFYETGGRALHGNFYWQNFMCLFLLFFVCILQLLQLISANQNSWKKYRIEISIFALHFLSGILYFIKILVTNDYS
jgi:hypothetical protein